MDPWGQWLCLPERMRVSCDRGWMGVFSKQLEDIKIIPNLSVHLSTSLFGSVGVCVCRCVLRKPSQGFYHEALRAAIAAAGTGVHAHPQCTSGGHRRGGRLLWRSAGKGCCTTGTHQDKSGPEGGLRLWPAPTVQRAYVQTRESCYSAPLSNHVNYTADAEFNVQINL